MDLKSLGTHLHTNEDVGFKDAPGPHVRGKGPGLLNPIASLFLLIALVALAVVAIVATAVAIGALSLFASVPVFLSHAAGGFLGINQALAGGLGLGEVAHPWRRTEHGDQSTPISDVADQIHQDPQANTKEFLKVYQLLKEGARAYYGRPVRSDDKAAEAAIAQGVAADTNEKVRDFLTKKPRDPQGRQVRSYVDWVEKNSQGIPQNRRPFKDLVPWGIGQIDVTIGQYAYQMHKSGHTYSLDKQ